MFGREVSVGVFFFYESIMQRGSLFKGILKLLNKAILWLFLTTICGYFVYIVIIKTHILLTAAPPFLQARGPGCPESSHRARPLWSALTHRGLGRMDPELTSICVLHSPSTFCVELALSSVSDGVSYSDGCNGEWLVSFLSQFVLLFDGRWNFSSFSTSPTWWYLGLCFPSQT